MRKERKRNSVCAAHMYQSISICISHVLYVYTAYTGISKYTWNVFYCTCSWLYSRQRQLHHYTTYNQQIYTINACLLQLNQIIGTVFPLWTAAVVVVVVAVAAFYLECHVDFDGLYLLPDPTVLNHQNEHVTRRKTQSNLAAGTTKHWHQQIGLLSMIDTTREFSMCLLSISFRFNSSNGIARECAWKKR